jgi:hypothetical protein
MAPTNPSTTNLEHWWSLDETSGARYDAHASADLTDVNTVGYATGKISNAAAFVAANTERLTINSQASLQFGNEAFSLGCWCKFATLTEQMVLMGKFNYTNSTSEYVLKYETGSQNKIAFDVSAGGQSFTTHRWIGTIATDTWYFVYAAHDPDNDIEILSVNAGSFQTKAYSAGCNAGTSKFQLGAMDDTAYPFYLNGYLDEAFLYRRLLTLDEVTWLYNSGAGRAYADVNPSSPSTGKQFRIIG